jgi:hypothetical protein
VIKKLTLLAGIAAGYVLGAKAGKERYEQIKSMAQDLRGRPQVQHATQTLQSTASDLADKAKGAVNEQVDKVTHASVDLTEPAPTGPMPGAAPSSTVV